MVRGTTPSTGKVKVSSSIPDPESTKSEVVAQLLPILTEQ